MRHAAQGYGKGMAIAMGHASKICILGALHTAIKFGLKHVCRQGIDLILIEITGQVLTSHTWKWTWEVLH